MEDNLLKEIYAGISKIWVWLFYIVIGIIGKLSYDMLQGRKMSWMQIFGAIGISLFCGVVSALFCAYKGWDEASKFIVPITTLLSEKIILALFSIDYKQLLIQIINKNHKD